MDFSAACRLAVEVLEDGDVAQLSQNRLRPWLMNGSPVTILG
jgi:hypothetical protein